MITVVVRERNSTNRTPSFSRTEFERFNQTSHIWVPPTDIFETNADFVIRIEVAGMSESDFNLLLEVDRLYVEGKRTDPAKIRAYHQMEIRFGEFHLCIDLPSNFDREKISASYKDGFLQINVPKTTPRSVKIEEG